MLYIKEIHVITHELTETRMQFFDSFYNKNLKFSYNATLSVHQKDLIFSLTQHTYCTHLVCIFYCPQLFNY